MSFEAVEILTTGQCPLNCEYCYIPKSEEMKKIHREIVEELKSGEYFEKLEKAVGNNIKILSFWGTEPGLTLGVLEKKLKEIFDRFSELETISFSTSTMRAVDPIISFAHKLEEVSPGTKLEVQISLDGHKLIVDKNRFKGASKIIPDNFFEIIKGLQDISNVNVDFSWKSTISIENIKAMNENPEEIDNLFNYFGNLNKKFDDINDNENVILSKKSFVPTLVVPGRYTSDDGREFAKFLKNVHEKGYTSSYTSRLKKVVDFSDEIWNKKRMFTCSGGDSQVGIGFGQHMCHRSFYMNDKRYIDSIMNSGIENNDVSLFEEGSIDLIKNWYIPDETDDYDKARFDYVMRGYHDFWKLSLAYTQSFVKELALAGQAQEKYLNDEEFLNLFSLFVNSAFSCPMENALNAGSPHLTPPSIIRILSNGAFEEILRTV